MKKPNKSIVAVAAAFILVAASAKADYLWTGGASADWTEGWGSGSGWYCLKNLTVAPTVLFSSKIDASADSGVLVEGTANYPVVFSATSPNGLTAKILGIGTGTYGEATLNGGTYTLSDLIAVPYDYWHNNTKGKLTIQAETAITANNLRIGGAVKNTGANGEVVMNGGEITLSDAINLCNQNNGTATFTMNGGTATTKYFVAGNKASANATATNAGGSLVVTDWMHIAENNSATGKFIQTAGATSVAGYLCVGSQDNNAKTGYDALFQLDAGTVTNTGTAMIIGARGDSTAQAKAVVNGGELVAKQIWVAEYSSGSNELEINNGLVVVSGDFYIARESGSNGKLTLNGGALQTTGIKTVATAAIDFNGGTITDAGSGSHTLVTATTTAKVLSGGAKFAVPGGSEAKILAPLATGVAEGETDGGLTKTGGGALTLASGNTFTGPTTVSEGLLVVPVGENLNALTIGAKGAIAVDISSAYTPDSTTSIELFTASSIDFEADNDALANAIFLKGYAVGYTLAYDETTHKVVATITSHSSTTSTVKTYAPTSSALEWADQAGAYSDRTLPSSYRATSSDTIVVVGDQVMNFYYNNGFRYYYFQTYAVRGGTFWPKHSTKGQFPNLYATRITGNGTIKLGQIGLQAESAITVDDGVTVEFTCDGVPNGAAQDTWVRNATVNGDIIVTNGVMRVYENVVFNGKVTIGAYSTASYVSNDTTFNGTLELLDGATFNLDSKTVTFGSDATLLLKGGTLSNTSALDISSAKVEVADSAYAFSSLPEAASYSISGGQITVAAESNSIDLSSSSLAVTGGKLVLNASGLTIQEGSTLTLTGVTFDDGVSAADAVVVSGAAFDWTPSVGQDGTVAFTAATPSGENVWVGGNKGYWNDAANWSYGVPGTELSAVFRNDAVVSFNGLTTVPTLGSLKIETDNVTLTRDGASADKFHLTEFGGYGTLTLNNLGCTQVNGSTLVVTNDIVFTGTSWLGDHNYNGLVRMEGDMLVESGNTCELWSTVNVYGDISGGGNLVIKQSKNTGAFYGDNSGFTGTFEKSDCDFRFMKPESGFPNATSVTINGTIWLWFDEGEIEFGGNFTAYATGNCGFNLPGTAEAVTMKVGGGNGSVIISRGWDGKWHPYYSAFVDSNGWQQGTDKFTLRKVGTGAITEYGVQSVYNFSLEGGSVNLGASNVYTGPDTRLTVTNATLGIAAATTVASADFQSGSTLQSTYYETTEDATTTYGVNLLTVTGAATLNGLTLTAAGTTPNVDTTYTVLSAASVSGSVESNVADPDETDKKVWIARVRQNSVKLMYGSKAPGFFVVIH